MQFLLMSNVILMTLESRCIITPNHIRISTIGVPMEVISKVYKIHYEIRCISAANKRMKRHICKNVTETKE